MTRWPTRLESHVWTTPSTPVAIAMPIMPGDERDQQPVVVLRDRDVEDVAQQERRDDAEAGGDDDQDQDRRQPAPVGRKRRGDAACVKPSTPAPRSRRSCARS